MQREEAITAIKEIFYRCPYIEGKSLKLMPPDADSVLSKGCQIHIETRQDITLDNCLAAISQRLNLAVHSEGDLLIIYKPTKNRLDQ